MKKTVYLYKTIFVAVFLFITPISAQKVQSTQPIKDTLRYLANQNYQLQNSMYDLYKTHHADIVMLGNSLTHGVAWNELLGRSNVVERGIKSDVLYGYEARLGSIYRLNPKIVFIMGGINDIYNWTHVEEIFSIYIRIVNSLKSKNIIPVIQSTIYSSKTWGKSPEVNFGRNREVDKLNKLLSDYAKKNNLDYLDLNFLTAGNDGFLRPELTFDGIHFKADAYKIWVREVEKILAKYNL